MGKGDWRSLPRGPRAPRRTGAYWQQMREAEKRIFFYAFSQVAHINDVARMLGLTEIFLRRRCSVLKIVPWQKPAKSYHDPER